MSERTILPSNASRLMQSIDLAVAKQLAAIPLQSIIDQWSPDKANDNLLPWLGWAVDVFGLDSALSAERYRAVLSQSIDTHKSRGVEAGIRQAFAAIGFTNISIDKGRSSTTYGAADTHDGYKTYGNTGIWWNAYRVKVGALLNAAQAASVRTLLAAFAPVRCTLQEISFNGQALHNNVISHNGQFSYGTY